MKHKTLSPSNWKSADPTSTQFGRHSRLVGPVPLTEADWVHQLLAVDLKNAASHLDQPAYMPPTAVLGTFKACAHDINRLFMRAARCGPANDESDAQSDR